MVTPRLSIQVTPRNGRLTSPRSPPKPARPDPQILVLKKVLGSTATSPNSFDLLEPRRCFAHTAGAAVVVTTLNDAFEPAKQAVFRARPSSSPINITTPLYDSPTPLCPVPRSRTAPALGAATSNALTFGSPWGDGLDSPNGRNGGSKERTKAATCVSLSRDGKFVAVGETGYRPRVLIFSTSADVPSDVPLTSLSEHSFGIRCLSFSPNSQYLASLGDINDGFLHVWSINQRNGSATIEASNKCTSNVKQMLWLGSKLVTIGTRHVKLWRIEDGSKYSPSKKGSDNGSMAFMSPSLRTLAGRNCLLGPMLDKVFTAAVPVTQSTALVCSDQGDICLLDDNENVPRFTQLAKTDFSIAAVTVLKDKSVVVSGPQGQLEQYALDELLGAGVSGGSPTNIKATCNTLRQTGTPIIMMACLADRLVVVDSGRNISVGSIESIADNSAVKQEVKQIPAHAGSVLGVFSLSESKSHRGSFLTWSSEGFVIFWDAEGNYMSSLNVLLEQLVDDDYDVINELKVVTAFREKPAVVTGDLYGVLRVIEHPQGSTAHDVKAHAGEITDIATFEDTSNTLVASAGRDRMVQLFAYRAGVVELVQTLDEHYGAVNSVRFTKDGRKLVSCSADRTIVVREAVAGADVRPNSVAFVCLRTVALKASPLSIDMGYHSDGCLIVSTADKAVSKVDISSGAVTSTLKASDTEGGDAVVLNLAIGVTLSRSSTLTAGISSTDKSIRLYDESGRLAGREYGHTEGMTGIAVVFKEEEPEKKTLVTAAADGTVFMWGITTEMEQIQDKLEALDVVSSSAMRPLAGRPPLRRVLSSSELTKLRGLREEDERGTAASLESMFLPRNRSPGRRSTRLSLLSTPKLEPSPRLRQQRSSDQLGASSMAQKTRRLSVSRPSSPPSARAQTVRGPPRPSSPPSARAQTVRGPPRPPPATSTARPRRKSLGLGEKAESTNELANATRSLCRSLHAYRKQLAVSSDVLPLDSARELERELSSTARALAEKSARNESAMVKLLDQYSERLVSMLDEKIASSVAQQVRREMAEDDAER